MAEETEPKVARLMSKIPIELDQRLRDPALILGVKQQDVVANALDKYLDAVAKTKGEKFTIAMDAIASVRELSDEA